MMNKVDVFKPYDFKPLNIYESRVREVMDTAKANGTIVPMVTIATKPDFYKQWSLVDAAKKRGMPVLVLHTGQHHDELVGWGTTEFRLDEDIGCDLAVRGDLLQKTTEMIFKIGWFGRYLKEHWPEVTVIPVVHGDTLTAGMVPVGWQFSTNEKCAQNEAGLRGMAPEAVRNMKSLTVEDFVQEQWYGKWNIDRSEPFPEQYDTFIGGAGSEFLFAPNNLNKEHLIREGYPEDRIWVVGNSVVDAVEQMKKLQSGSVFDVYPELEEGEWIRADIHRRGNLTEKRFKSIVSSINEIVNDGYNLVLVELTATRRALDFYDLREGLVRLSQENKNFLMTGLWPEYFHVMEFLNSSHCIAELTDSGSMQEELNHLKGVICLTCRFNTDRPETVFDAHSNLLVPPLSSEHITSLVKYALEDDDTRNTLLNAPRLYGESVGDKIIDIIEDIDREGLMAFRWSHEVNGLWNEKSSPFRYL